MKKSLAPLTIAFALMLTACGGGASETPSNSPSQTESSAPAAEEKIPGKGNISSSGVDFTTLTPEDLKLTTKSDFGFITEHGTEGTISFVEKSDSRVAEIEKYRKKVRGYEIEYMIVDADNRKGTSSANMYAVNVYDPEGMKYEYMKLQEVIGDWRPETDYDNDTSHLSDGTSITDKEMTALYNEGIELSNAQRSMLDVSEKGYFVLGVPLGEGFLPKEIERVAVMANGGFDETPAYNQLVSEYREWKAFQEAGKEWVAFDPDAPAPEPSTAEESAAWPIVED